MPPDAPHWSGWAVHHGPPPFMGFLGGLIFLLFCLAVGLTLFLLARKGRFGDFQRMRFAHHAPEAEAKKILAERFARGEISTDEFLERASVLNWTPGVAPHEPPHGKKHMR